MTLQSSVMGATQTPYTLDEIQDNENAYQNEVAPRLTSMDTLRNTKKVEITSYLSSTVSSENITSLLSAAQQKEYVNDVNALLNDSTKTDLYSLDSTKKEKIMDDTALIGAYSDEKRLVLLFQQDWANKRKTICTTNDPSNDIYKK